MQNMTITKRASQLRGGRDREREMTYHHLSSEELWDCSLNTSAFHFVLYVVQELQCAHTHTHRNSKYRQLLSTVHTGPF